jgi:mRNA interferase MazF
MGRHHLGRHRQLMRRGEIRLVNLEAAVGAEANKRRPAVIVSNDSANTAAARLGRGVLTVVPLTSNIDRVHPFQVLLERSDTGLDDACKAQAEQVTSIDIRRIGTRVGTLPTSVMQGVDDALRVHLAL